MPVFEIEANGKTYEVEAPDQSAAVTAFGGKAATEATKPEVSVLADVGKSAGIGAAKGLVGLAGLPGDISELGARGIDKATQFVGGMLGVDVEPRQPREPTYGSADIQREIESITGDFYTPKTGAGQFAQTVGEFTPGMIGGGGGLLMKAGARVLAPALGSEAAGRVAKGTEYEPLARVAGGVAAGLAAGGLASAVRRPATAAGTTADDLSLAAKQAYESPEVKALAIKPSSAATAAGSIKQGLHVEGLDANVAPMTFSVVKKLEKPVGNTVNISDVDNVRKVLGKIGGNFNQPIEQQAARVAIQKIDDYLANISQGDVIAGDAAKASTILKEARGNWAAKSRLDKINKAEYRGELSAAASHSGQNANNATRQAVKNILLNDKQRRGFSDEEIKMMEKVVKGTATGNIMRSVGKLLAHNGLGGLATGGMGFAAGTPFGPVGQAIGAIGLPLAGAAARKAGDVSTVRSLRELETLIASRSPLAASRALPIPKSAPIMNSGVVGGLLGANSSEGPLRLASDPRSRKGDKLKR